MKNYLIVTRFSDSYTVNMTPVGLPDPSQWYVVWNGTIILTPEENGKIYLVVDTKETSIIDLEVNSTNSQYYPLLPIIQLNASSLYNAEAYVIPFATAGNAYIVDWNGVQWNPLLDEYSQPNFGYAGGLYNPLCRNREKLSLNTLFTSKGWKFGYVRVVIRWLKR